MATLTERRANYVQISCAFTWVRPPQSFFLSMATTFEIPSDIYFCIMCEKINNLNNPNWDKRHDFEFLLKQQISMFTTDMETNWFDIQSWTSFSDGVGNDELLYWKPRLGSAQTVYERRRSRQRAGSGSGQQADRENWARHTWTVSHTCSLLKEHSENLKVHHDI